MRLLLPFLAACNSGDALVTIVNRSDEIRTVDVEICAMRAFDCGSVQFDLYPGNEQEVFGSYLGNETVWIAVESDGMVLPSAPYDAGYHIVITVDDREIYH